MTTPAPYRLSVAQEQILRFLSYAGEGRVKQRTAKVLERHGLVTLQTSPFDGLTTARITQTGREHIAARGSAVR